ncbi:MAG: hypothetical protein O3A00_24305 [Planctomycetota bacterium]|nr:hypothetical protein [Planctomycetota bacterium]
MPLTKFQTHVSILLTLVSCVVIVGCGDDDEADSGDTSIGQVSEIAEAVIEANGNLRIPEVATLATPGPGYRWKLVEKTNENGVEFFKYACTAPDSSSALALQIQGRKADDFVSRLKIADEFYKTLVSTMNQQQCTNLEVARGRYTKPFPDWSRRRLAGKRPDGAGFTFKIDTTS